MMMIMSILNDSNSEAANVDAMNEDMNPQEGDPWPGAA